MGSRANTGEAQPGHINAAYAVLGPLYLVWKALFPKYVTTTELVGRAMINVARRGAPQRVLENQDINREARG